MVKEERVFLNEPAPPPLKEKRFPNENKNSKYDSGIINDHYVVMSFGTLKIK